MIHFLEGLPLLNHPAQLAPLFKVYLSVMYSNGTCLYNRCGTSFVNLAGRILPKIG